MVENELTTIQISKKLAMRIRIWKAKLGCKTLEEIIDHILKITPASEINKLKK